jgi:4-hydroxybenzoate polyprenyltransferase
MRSVELLKVSRPGLWLVFIWLYLWPTGGHFSLLFSPTFWCGLLYCTFPLNLLVYGMNDMVDEDVDRPNSRKGNYIFGACLDRKSLIQLPMYMAAFNIVPLMTLVHMDPSLAVYSVVWLSAAFGVNYMYNNQPFQLSRKCPYELPTMIIGHLLIPHLACRINHLPLPSFSSLVFHILLLSRSHIWLEYADIAVDRVAGKRTIAVALGHSKALVLVITLTVLESLCGFFMLGNSIVGLFSLFGVVVFVLSFDDSDKKQKSSSVFVSVSQSLVGVGLMVYLWTNSVFR